MKNKEQKKNQSSKGMGGLTKYSSIGKSIKGSKGGSKFFKGK